MLSLLFFFSSRESSNANVGPYMWNSYETKDLQEPAESMSGTISLYFTDIPTTPTGRTAVRTVLPSGFRSFKTTEFNLSPLKLSYHLYPPLWKLKGRHRLGQWFTRAIWPEGSDIES